MLDLIKIIIQNWIGGLIGLVIAVILSLILGFTAFKGNKIVSSIITLLLVIAFSFAGVFIQNNFFNKEKYSSSIPSEEERADELDKEIIDGWDNTNGGFTFEQIIEAQDDEDCPTYNDQIITMKCYDFGSYVAFSFKKNNLNQNAVFLKTENGLIYDGMLNMTGDFESRYYGLWTTVFLDKWSWFPEKDKVPYYYTKSVPPGGYTYDDLVSVSSGKASFMRYDHFFQYNWGGCEAEAIRQGIKLSSNNITDNFIKFNEVELVGSKDSASIKINSFYNYLYNQVKSLDFGSSKVVDSTGLMCVPIPKDLQSNYPVGEDFKEKYPDIEYYGVYNCDIAVHLQFLNGNKQISSTSKSEDYVDKNKDKDITKVETIETKQELTRLEINLKDTKNSDFTNIDLVNNPVIINFKNEDLNLSKTITVKSVDDLSNQIDVLLNKNVEWTYTISSNALIFENFIGKIYLSKDYQSVTFEYYYLNNYTVVSVGLNPIGTIDVSQINLSQYPVRIILTNENESFQFLFDNNNKLNSYVSQFLPVGEYESTFLSEQLIFSAVTGSLTITTTDKTMLFNYALALEEGDLSFKLTYLSDNPVSDYPKGYVSIYSSFTNVDIIRSHLSGSLTYNVILSIYDDEGKLLVNCTHIHNNSGSCVDGWSANLLENGMEYIAQLRFTDASDSSVTYLSDILRFTYSDNTRNCFRYDVTEVK